MLKKSLIAILAAGAVTAQASTTNLLQSVSVAFQVYDQGSATSAGGNTVNKINSSAYSTKALIQDLNGSYASGDILVRVVPVLSTSALTTNVTAVSTNTVSVTVTNTGTAIELLTNGTVLFTNITNSAGGVSNVVFGTSTSIGGDSVVASNFVSLSLSNVVISNVFFIGTNTTVATTTTTNSTNYVFTQNSITTSADTNKLGTASFGILNGKTLTALPTNVSFSIGRDEIYTTTNTALLHGEIIKANGVIKGGQTVEIRTLVISNATSQILLKGYAKGSYVDVSVGKGTAAEVVSSEDFHWTGSGSGVVSSNDEILDGTISETYIKTFVQ